MQNEQKAPGGSKTALTVVALAFAVTMAVIVGNRLSDQALAVLAGSVCGVAAAIPTSLLILAIARWRDRPKEEPMPFHPIAPGYPPYPQQYSGYPPVIVIAPPQGQLPQWGSPYPSPFGPPVEREFTVVGGEGTDENVPRRYPV